MNNRHIFVLSAVLVAISIALFVYKWRVLGFPIAQNEKTQIWNVEAAVQFEPGPAAIKATLRIPSLTPGFALLDEMRGDLVSEEVEVDPAIALSPDAAAEQPDVERSRLFDIANRKGQMERREIGVRAHRPRSLARHGRCCS